MSTHTEIHAHPTGKLLALQSLVLLATLGVAALLVIFQARALSNARRLAAEVEESRRLMARQYGLVVSIGKGVDDSLQDFARLSDRDRQAIADSAARKAIELIASRQARASIAAVLDSPATMGSNSTLPANSAPAITQPR